MTTTTDDLRRALAERATAIDIPATPPVRLVRQRVLVERLRTVSTVAAAVLLVTGLVTVLRDRTSPPSTVDTRLGVPDAGSASTTTTTIASAPAGAGASDAGAPGAGGAPAPAREGTTTTIVPDKVGPIRTSNSPPTTRGAAEPTYAVAQPGYWYFMVHGSDSRFGHPLVGEDDGRNVTADGSRRVRPAEGRRQRTEVISSARLTVAGEVRTLADDVRLQELTLYDGYQDTLRVFPLKDVFEIPAERYWGRWWSYEATSTDGKTHIRVRSKVEGRDTVFVPYGPTLDAVKVDSVIDVSGDRTAHLERSEWWSVDLGVALKIHEVEKGTTSGGTSFEKDVLYELYETTPSAGSVNGQLTEDKDGDGLPQ